MLLSDLLEKDEARVTGALNVDITALSMDSRKVVPGALFAALQGVKYDGTAFVNEALTCGASAILSGKPAPAGHLASIPWIEAQEPRQLLAKISARFHGRQPKTIVGITGTSGKTSVANFLRQIYTFCGYSAASLGTLGVVTQQGQSYGSLTTPDPIAMHWLLAQLAQGNITHVALEASSHGLDQYRLDGVNFTAGAFTNLTRDHLDYHPTMDDYLRAKLRLVNELLPPGAPFVVSADSPYAEDFINAARQRKLKLLTVGAGGEDLHLISHDRLPQGQRLSLGGPWGRAEVMLPLIGDFQAANVLVAAGLAIATGCEHAKVFAALEQMSGVKGRMEKVGEYHGAGIYVDYAHKPDALAKLLDSMRPYTQGKLVVVFGCGGDRDPGKRPLMGTIASEKADIVIVTDDNPRTENAAQIRSSILEAAPKAIEIPDRAQAIKEAVARIAEGDILVVAGKGHETGQIIGTDMLPFSDHDVISAALGSAAA
ncbi:MAG: UDP-N-acetylmuramoyl-L-alanyl-D-glutamate--2,6-diaminopimelate ligase [Pseudomonadota bacterium]